MTAHAPGWPHPRGGAGTVAAALVAYARSLGVTFTVGQRVQDINALPRAHVYLFDVAPRHLSQIAEARLPESYRRGLQRYRYGPAAYKVDWALSDPLPWRDEACRLAATVHLAGTLEEIEAAEASVWAGELAEKPFVLVAQPTVFDPTRAPPRRHTAWAYAHVPF